MAIAAQSFLPKVMTIKGVDYDFEPFRNRFGESRWRTEITCPICKEVRWINKRNITESTNFTHRCFKCNWQSIGFGKLDKHSSWKGGRTHLSSGYICVRVPNDNIFNKMANKGGYVLEHRLVVARSIGRPLKDSEHVHHLNGDKTDNRLENLVLIDGGIHQIVTALEEKIKRLENEITLLKGGKS